MPERTFFAYVLGIEIVEYLLETDEQVVIFVSGINAFGHGNHLNFVLAQVVNEECCLCSVMSKSAQILDKDNIDLAIINRIFEFAQAFSVEAHSRNVVVKALSNNLITILFGVVQQDLPLIMKTVRFLVLIAG